MNGLVGARCWRSRSWESGIGNRESGIRRNWGSGIRDRGSGIRNGGTRPADQARAPARHSLCAPAAPYTYTYSYTSVQFVNPFKQRPMPIDLGIIEGFYGKPWTWEARAETMRFLAPHG